MYCYTFVNLDISREAISVDDKCYGRVGVFMMFEGTKNGN